MIYLFAGNDTKKKNKEFEKFLKTLPRETTLFLFDGASFDRGQVEGFFSGNSLFWGVSAIVFSGILEKEEIREFIFEKMGQLSESSNFFIFKEGVLKKAVTDEFKKARAELNIFESKEVKEEKFNNFTLANDLGRRDKLSLWLHFRQAVDAGASLEELVGVLFWKSKDMILKKNTVKFKEEELKNIASSLSYLLPKARREGRDAEASFEEFLLEKV